MIRLLTGKLKCHIITITIIIIIIITIIIIIIIDVDNTGIFHVFEMRILNEWIWSSHFSAA